MRNATKDELDLLVGSAIVAYRKAIEEAFEFSHILMNFDIDRPWITVECSHPKCDADAKAVKMSDNSIVHKHRIRLEIR